MSGSLVNSSFCLGPIFCFGPGGQYYNYLQTPKNAASSRFYRKVNFFKRIYFYQIHTITMHIKFWKQHCNLFKTLKPYTLAGFEPGIFCSVGGRDDHYATPPGLYRKVCIQLTYLHKQGKMGIINNVKCLEPFDKWIVFIIVRFFFAFNVCKKVWIILEFSLL
jgi:hypothetical protein